MAAAGWTGSRRPGGGREAAELRHGHCRVASSSAEVKNSGMMAGLSIGCRQGGEKWGLWCWEAHRPAFRALGAVLLPSASCGVAGTSSARRQGRWTLPRQCRAVALGVACTTVSRRRALVAGHGRRSRNARRWRNVAAQHDGRWHGAATSARAAAAAWCLTRTRLGEACPASTSWSPWRRVEQAGTTSAGEERATQSGVAGTEAERVEEGGLGQARRCLQPPRSWQLPATVLEAASAATGRSRQAEVVGTTAAR